MGEDLTLTVFPSVVSSLIVGLGVGWLATQKALAVYQVRLQALELAVDRLSDNSARLVRVETLLEVSLGLRSKGEAE